MNKQDFSLILFSIAMITNVFAQTGQNGWLLLISLGIFAIIEALIIFKKIV